MDSDDVPRCRMTSNDLKRPQMTSNNLDKPNTDTECTLKRTFKKRNKTIQKAESVHEKIEFNDEYLDEFLHNNNFYMELAMQIVSNDKTVRSNTLEETKEFNSQHLTTPAKKGTISFYDACY